MHGVLSTLALIAAVAVAQQRCDAEYPEVYCNTTEILAYQSYDCKPYHIFIARGSDEPYPGRQGNITSQICASLGKDQCSFESVEYPAKSTAWGKEEWCKSAAKGASGGQAQVKGYSEKCPDSKLILLGYSQGGSVTQDIIGGGGGHVFECDQVANPALDSSLGEKGGLDLPHNLDDVLTVNKVVAVVTFGAVARSRNQNFTIGDGKPFDGTRARTTEQLAALNKYSDRLRDYCHFGDPICAVGSTPVQVSQHLDYFIMHNEEVLKWVTEKAKGTSEKVSHINQHTSTNPFQP
jgi:acetylxylan esterase